MEVYTLESFDFRQKYHPLMPIMQNQSTLSYPIHRLKYSQVWDLDEQFWIYEEFKQRQSFAVRYEPFLKS